MSARAQLKAIDSEKDAGEIRIESDCLTSNLTVPSVKGRRQLYHTRIWHCDLATKHRTSRRTPRKVPSTFINGLAMAGEFCSPIRRITHPFAQPNLARSR